MLGYAFISVVAVMLANWRGKSISQSTDMMETSVICNPTNTKTGTNWGNFTLDYNFRVCGMLIYAFISAVAVMLANWHGKRISQSNDMTETLSESR